MDGYAVRADDIRGASREQPTRLSVIATVKAGGSSSVEVERGTAVRIMTGAPVPGGADSVVRVEDTDGGRKHVMVHSDRDALRNIRPRGEDLGEGALAVHRGQLLQPGTIGLLASVGRSSVRVHRRPRVAILASGDELVDVDRFADVMAGTRIITSNSYSLHAAVSLAGAEPIPLGFVGDDPAALRERILSIDCDLLLTTGGVSVGEFDHTRSVIEELGATRRFWRVKIRPGAPLGFGMLRGIPWLGLPGNPVSTLVTFELFARPAIRRLAGHTALHRRRIGVAVAEAITINAPLTHFLRAEVKRSGNGELLARLTGPQGSGLLSSMSKANALLVVPPERQRIEAGDSVPAIFLNDETNYEDSPPV